MTEQQQPEALHLAYNFELKAIKELRAALEQPDHSEQSYMGCVTSDMHELAEWLNTMYEDSKEQITALEQPQVVRETAPNGATHIQPQQGAFYKRVDEKWYVWSRMEDGCPHRWYISPGTVESCLKPISAATERLQNHVPDAGDMVPAGWKLVPVEPTVEMMDAGGAATRRCYQHLNKGEVMCSYVYRHMLAAAPQPPTTEQSSAVQPQVEQEPGYLDGGSRYKVTHLKTSGYCIIGLPGELLGCWVALVDATDNKHIDGPQPKREPLTDDDVERLWYQNRGVSLPFTRAIERAHGIGGET